MSIIYSVTSQCMLTIWPLVNEAVILRVSFSHSFYRTHLEKFLSISSYDFTWTQPGKLALLLVRIDSGRFFYFSIISCGIKIDIKMPFHLQCILLEGRMS